MTILDKFLQEVAYEDVTEFAVSWARELGQPTIIKLCEALREIALRSVDKRDSIGACTSWYAVFGLVTAYKLSLERQGSHAKRKETREV